MLLETPEDTYKAYRKFLRKGGYYNAYRCLEKLLAEFPEDIELLEEIVNLCMGKWEEPTKAKPWLAKLTKIRSLWFDFVLFAQVEAELKNIVRAKEHLNKAKELHKTQNGKDDRTEAKEILRGLDSFIAQKEHNISTKSIVESEIGFNKERKDAPLRSITPQAELKGDIEEKPPSQPIKKAPLAIPLYNVPIKIEPFKKDAFLSFLQGDELALEKNKMFIDYTYITLQRGYDELLCLSNVSGVEKYWYQIETVKKVLRYFHGRVLLCDEVGLGKTIEAGMVIKEYLMRGLVKNVLILVPSSLVYQWKEEMLVKFGLEFLSTNDYDGKIDTAKFWKQKLIIASINIAKSTKTMPMVIEQFYDLVIVDEAHHLRNRTTLAWKLVNQIKKKFILLLTATPVQNNLVELFNLITLLKPGQFKTEKIFKQEYLCKGELKSSANKERLRELLRDVMIRNTRSTIDLKLPKRFASTLRLKPTEQEKQIYTGVNEYLKKSQFNKTMINLILKEAGSSPFALRDTLTNLASADGVKNILEEIDNLRDTSKGCALVDIHKKNPLEKKVIFTHYIKTMDYIAHLFSREGFQYIIFRGDMSNKEKETAITKFKEDVPLLISTESGGEGRNLQFCNTIINFDLPWNPMRIEQRIGRLHRIGQARDVFIFNLSIKETIEDYIIEILDNKINMFEMVIGEIEPILGSLGEDKDFEDIIMEMWLVSSNREELKGHFEKFGIELIEAKKNYLNTKVMDNEIFGEDYEI